MHIYVISCGEYRKIGVAADVESRRRAMAIGCPHPLGVDFSAECQIAHANRAEYGAHWLLAEKWHFGEWFEVSAEEAIEAVKSAISWAESGEEHPYLLLGLEPEDPEKRGIYRLAVRARQQAYMAQPNRKSGKRQQAATLASSLARARRKAEKLDKIRERWHDRAHDTDALIEETGLSRRTVYNELGPRFEGDAGIEHA